MTVDSPRQGEPTVVDRLVVLISRAHRSRRTWVILVLVIFAAAIAPDVGLSPYWTIQIQEMAFLALIISGLNLSYGYAGELALGQVAVYAVGAYLGAYMALHGVNDLFLTLAAAALTAGLIGVISGMPGMRLGGWALAMTSFFLILLVPDIVLSLSSITGGYNGLPGIPTAEVFGHALTSRQLYWVTLAVLLIWLLFLRNLVESRHGAALRVLKASPILASSLGVPVYRLKVTAYGLGAIPAGLAGVLFAYQQQYVSVNAFTFTAAVGVIAGSVIGGVDSIYGALAGGALLQIGPEQASNFSEYSSIVYGAVLIVGGVAFSGGLAGIGRKALAYIDHAASIRSGAVQGGDRSQGHSAALVPAPDADPDAAWVGGNGLELEVKDACRGFGGIQALDHVSLVAHPGRITALIGSNGSGKTTMLNGISGLVRFDSGSVLLGGTEVSRQPSHRIARLGVSRTFQTPAIPQSLPVWEVVAGSRYVRPRVGVLAAALRLPKYRKVSAEDRVVAEAALATVGIHHRADELATSLSLGTQRLVEVARALAASPSVILLDEPASGLETSEVEQLAETLKTLRAHGQTVVLVEHNFRFVLSIADDIYLLDRGTVIASGSPQHIMEDDAAMAAYLGGSSVRRRLPQGPASPDNELKVRE